MGRPEPRTRRQLGSRSNQPRKQDFQASSTQERAPTPARPRNGALVHKPGLGRAAEGEATPFARVSGLRIEALWGQIRQATKTQNGRQRACPASRRRTRPVPRDPVATSGNCTPHGRACRAPQPRPRSLGRVQSEGLLTSASRSGTSRAFPTVPLPKIPCLPVTGRDAGLSPWPWGPWWCRARLSKPDLVGAPPVVKAVARSAGTGKQHPSQATLDVSTGGSTHGWSTSSQLILHCVAKGGKRSEPQNSHNWTPKF